MASTSIKTTANQRFRTEMKVLTNATLGGLEAAYNAYEAGKATDTTKTWEVKVVNSYFDGANYVAVCEARYPEIGNDPLGQVPILT